MAKMVPPTIDSDVKSNAERKVFNWFENLKWDKCIVLHSLGIANHINNIFGEIDFVVISSEGILCVEVKGGNVSRSNGRWTFTNRFGISNSKNQGPFEQAQGNMHSLRQHLQKQLPNTDPIYRTQFACCVITPDCIIKSTSPDIIHQITFNSSDNPNNLKKYLTNSYNYWREQCIKQHGFEGGRLSFEDIGRTLEILRGDFKFIPSLSMIIESIETQLLEVTDEQYLIMNGFADNERLLVSGAAGTGKTLLAIEQCRKLSLSGKKVLYLCFNKRISRHIKEIRDKRNETYEVYNLHELMCKICGFNEDDEYDSNFFKTVLPERFIHSLDIKKRHQYDAIIIDEGQDLMNINYYMCIDMLINGGFSKGEWAIYFDPYQNIFNSDNEFHDIWKNLKDDATSSYLLTINCRNTKQIAIANKMITNIKQASILKADGINVEYYAFSSMEDEKRKLIKVIRNLRSNGISRGDIVILSPYGKNNTRSCMSDFQLPSDLGLLRINPDFDLKNPNYINYFTIQSFKGLESKVIILVDIDDFISEKMRLLNYIAISRARTLLYVFYSNKVENQRQAMLLNGALM